ncbi:flagellar type III secretion system pore protein FliP [bacterium]|nr:flagellar type III secretion system pore protein FliP [bacterium]
MLATLKLKLAILIRCTGTPLLCLACLLALAAPAFAQEPESAPAPENGLSVSAGDLNVTVNSGDGDAASIFKIIALFTLMTVAPTLILMVTPFTRVIIVLSLLRNALGTQQSPPNQVLIGLAVVISAFIMMPRLAVMNDEVIKPYNADEISLDEALALGTSHLQEFMYPNTRTPHKRLFARLARIDSEEIQLDSPDNVHALPLHVLLPAFIISELTTAFQLGFVIYLPFLVVDMVVASILMSMGMMMLPPVLISLPFKLLMFIMANGWAAIIEGLVSSYWVSPG